MNLKQLQYEVDERERCVREIYSAHDCLGDTLSHLELKELTLHELQDGIVAESTTVLCDLLKQHRTGTESLFAAFDQLNRKFNEAIKKTDALEQNQAKGTLEAKVRNKQRLRDLENAMIVATRSASRLLEAKQSKESELVELDIQTADITSEIENNEVCLTAANKELLSRHDETETLHRGIAKHKAGNAQEDFKCSAELGKRAETITTLKDKIAEETKTAAVLEEETAKLAKAVQAAVERGQSVSRQISTAQQDLDRSRSEARDLHTTTAALQLNHASLTSDLAAVNHLRQTIALQSFKPRADQLTEELREITTCNQRLEAEMKLLQEQVTLYWSSNLLIPRHCYIIYFICSWGIALSTPSRTVFRSECELPAWPTEVRRRDTACWAKILPRFCTLSLLPCRRRLSWEAVCPHWAPFVCKCSSSSR